ncbi:hypothetical protein [Algibacter luteus]|jgi:hypothetical protein|uniref:Uncharacterized protein n=1 Tax=Algibacter luteus TaxID=1178825 RepID=A0A1M6GRC2_9FLAO|nr:hypothetical protein [Algibacter luteus]SHJ12517.1 hypothetical protein SAMN05216261_2868 [Algibacter luteus]
MKTKKYLVAIAIFGGVLFLTQAVNTYNVDAQATAKIEKSKIKLAPRG